MSHVGTLSWGSLAWLLLVAAVLRYEASADSLIITIDDFTWRRRYLSSRSPTPHTKRPSDREFPWDLIGGL
eukprot:c47998_g1_i1 orf=170-382(+)